MLKFEEYLNQFNAAINLSDFVISIAVTAILAMILRWFYIRYGNALSNRKRFAANFMPLALATMLIITIVKSSIALSLGLVGALSIVRFRAAIKDPEELTYLFLVIGLGLATGANQIAIALVAFSFILLILFLYKKFEGKTPFRSEDRLYININTDTTALEPIIDIVTDTLSYVDLKRLDVLPDNKGMDLSFIGKAESIQQLASLKTKLNKISPATSLSVVDQPDLIA